MSLPLLRLSVRWSNVALQMAVIGCRSSKPYESRFVMHSTHDDGGVIPQTLSSHPVTYNQVPASSTILND